jgi:hypothetical protein
MLSSKDQPKYYCYVYFDPRHSPPLPIYVGKGHGARDMQHLKKCSNPHMARKLAKIREAGLEPIIQRVTENLTHAGACEVEMRLIREIGREDLGLGPLCNFTDGGEGTPGRIVSEETRALWSSQRKGKKQTPAQYAVNCSRKPDSEETRQKKSAGNKGHRRHTPEQIDAIRKHGASRIISQETRDLWSLQRKGKEHKRDKSGKFEK